MKHLLPFLLLTLLDSQQSSAQNRMWDLQQLDTSCIALARQAIGQTPVAVTDKITARSGNRQNFESLSIYYWPDPTDPTGPYIVRDGVYNPEYQQYDLPRLRTLVQRLSHLAQAYHLTGERPFLDAYLKQLDTWFVKKRTRMRPDFEYAQFIPGRNNGKGHAAGLIDAYLFNDVVESIRLVESHTSLGSKRSKALRRWFARFAAWMQESPNGRQAAAFKNNIGVAYDVTLYNFLLFCNAPQAAQERVAQRCLQRIDTQINDRGEQPEELKRPMAFTYSVYNLGHILDFCRMRGEMPEKVALALDYLNRYTGRREQFPYQETGDWNYEEKKLQHLLRQARTLRRPNTAP